MSEAKHTPGPWFVFGNGMCVGGPFTPGPGDDPKQETAGVAMCGMQLRYNEEAEANAALIAAAPELLAACELWDQGFVDGEEFDADQFLAWVNRNRRAARAAIAKARSKGG